jgi:hypothetical protein
MGSGSFRGAALAAVLAAGLAASGCSSAAAGSQSAANLMPRVEAAARTATSVHMSGFFIQGTHKETIDMSFSGHSVAGTVGMNGANLVVLSLAGKTYIKLDAAFLKSVKAPVSACVTICGRYVELPASNASQVTGSLNLQQLEQQLFSSKHMSSVAPGDCVFAPVTVNGQSVLQCRHGANTIEVAAQGKPYPVYFTGPHGQHVAFSDWNAVTMPAAPAASQVISLASLGG